MRIVSLALAGAFGLCAAAQAQTPKLEKPRISLSVGGSISQMNKVAYVVALHRKYFEQEGLTVESVAFASGTAEFAIVIAPSGSTGPARVIVPGAGSADEPATGGVMALTTAL